MIVKEKKINKEIGAGAALVAAGAASAAISFEKVLTEVPAGSAVTTGTVQPFGWTLSDYGVTIKELSYNRSTSMWTVDAFKNGQLYGQYQMKLGENLFVPVNKYSAVKFSFEGNGPTSLKYTFIETIQQHNVLAYPWWHSEALIGGIVGAAIGAVAIAIGYKRLKKYNEMLRKEENDEQ